MPTGHPASPDAPRRPNGKLREHYKPAKYQRLKNSVRRYNAKFKYGITEAEVEALAVQQGGECAICEVPFDDPWSANIDHNHKTKKVRGLLCGRCNRRLHSVEDTTWLEKALDYLLQND